MKYLAFIVILFLHIHVFAQKMVFNPVTNTNWSCLFPISIGGLSFGTSDNPLADNFDRVRSKSTFVCYCPLFRFGITLGLNKPAYIAEATFTAFNLPSFGSLAAEAIFYQKGSSDAATKSAQRTSYVHTHIHKFNILELLNIFTDILCVNIKGAPFDILYLSEIDPVANNCALASMVFPESVFMGNPLVSMSCSADAISSTAGVPLDPMYWCFGAGSAYSACNYTEEPGSYEASVVTTIGKTMMRQQRYTLGKTFPLKTSQVAISACGFHIPSPIVLKSQYRLQAAYPFLSRCSRIGEMPMLWNIPKRSLLNGDAVFLLWEREDCCAL